MLGFFVLAACDEHEPQPPSSGERPDRQIAPEAVRAALDAAQQYFDAGESAKAETVLRELVAQAPGDVDGQELLARVLFQRAWGAARLGDDDVAETFYQQAYERYQIVLELRPDVAGFQQNAGEFALTAGRRDQALEHFIRAGRLDPTNSKHPLYEAQVLLQEGRIDDAQRAIDRVFAIDPDDPYALATQASIFMERGEYEEALRRIREARRLVVDRRERRAFRALEARYLRQAGEPKEALRLLLSLDAVARIDEAVTAEIAASYTALAQNDRAVETWAERFRRTRDWRAALRAARVALDGEMLDAAWRWFHEAETAAPPGHREVADLAEALRRVGEIG